MYYEDETGRRRIRPYSLGEIEHLLTLSQRGELPGRHLIVKRNRRGEISAATFVAKQSEEELLDTRYRPGQRYTFEEPLPGGFFVLQHRDLPGREDIERISGLTFESQQEIDPFLRAIFRAVPLSCLAPWRPDLPAAA